MFKERIISNASNILITFLTNYAFKPNKLSLQCMLCHNTIASNATKYGCRPRSINAGRLMA